MSILTIESIFLQIVKLKNTYNPQPFSVSVCIHFENLILI